MAGCRKCSTELVVGENWWSSYAKEPSYICIKCAKAYNHQYHVGHRKKHNERARQWRAQHRKEYSEANRLWRRNHPNYAQEYGCRWRKDNPDKSREQVRRRRARKANATIGIVDEVAVYELYNYTCIYCGATQNLTLDHVIALAVGGAHTEDNLVLACQRCNSSKREKPLADWLHTQSRVRDWVA